MSAFYAMNRNKFFILIPMPPLAAQIEMKNAVFCVFLVWNLVLLRKAAFAASG